MKRLCLLALTAMALACDGSPTSPSDLMGEVWRLVTIERPGGTPTVVADQARYTLEFLDERRLSVRADCNMCSGSYTLTGDALAIGALACTRAFCGASSLDTEFLQALTEARTIERARSLLTLTGDRLALRLRND